MAKTVFTLLVGLLLLVLLSSLANGNRCDFDEFECDNGVCIPDDERCDGTDDCFDDSDEENCNRCDSDEFECDRGFQCIPDDERCDGTGDCSDNSDEENCSITAGIIVGIVFGVLFLLCCPIGICVVCLVVYYYFFRVATLTTGVRGVRTVTTVPVHVPVPMATVGATTITQTTEQDLPPAYTPAYPTQPTQQYAYPPPEAYYPPQQQPAYPLKQTADPQGYFPPTGYS